MKRVLCTVAALLIVASAAFAGSDMTPQQTMEKVMNCPVCSAWGLDPTVGPTIRYDIQKTKSGFIESFVTANEANKAGFDKCAAECEKRAAGIPTMTAEQKAKLCPFCVAHMTIHRDDVSFDQAKTSLGMVMVASSTTPDGVKALHSYADTCAKTSSAMAQAGKEMQGQPAKAKM